jgi:hypothetical protein
VALPVSVARVHSGMTLCRCVHRDPTALFRVEFAASDRLAVISWHDDIEGGGGALSAEPAVPGAGVVRSFVSESTQGCVFASGGSAGASRCPMTGAEGAVGRDGAANGTAVPDGSAGSGEDSDVDIASGLMSSLTHVPKSALARRRRLSKGKGDGSVGMSSPSVARVGFSVSSEPGADERNSSRKLVSPRVQSTMRLTDGGSAAGQRLGEQRTSKVYPSFDSLNESEDADVIGCHSARSPPAEAFDGQVAREVRPERANSVSSSQVSDRNLSVMFRKAIELDAKVCAAAVECSAARAGWRVGAPRARSCRV